MDAAAIAISQTIKSTEGEGSKPIFDRNGLRVYAYTVDHSPVKPVFGYRFEYKGNWVVISGDTQKTVILIRYSKKADILICNGLSYKLMGIIAETAAKK